jgi:hypothetical protein
MAQARGRHLDEDLSGAGLVQFQFLYLERLFRFENHGGMGFHGNDNTISAAKSLGRFWLRSDR